MTLFLAAHGFHTDRRVGTYETTKQRTMKKDYSRIPESSADHKGSGSGGPVRFTLAGERGPTPPQADLPLHHRVLLVEDQADVARATAMGLEHLGAKVCIAGTGAAALEHSLTFRPTLVLLDIDLPDINGHEVGRRLRQMPELDAVALVALTSWNTPEMRQRSAHAGMVEHVAKPLDLDALAALLARIPVQSWPDQ
jgi:CheY-like chemotaxis protein